MSLRQNVSKADWLKWPNLVTMARMLISWIPGAIILDWISGGWWLALTAFALAAATDKLDGYLARKLEKVTKLGEFLDPLMDKFLVILTLFALCWVTPILLIPTAIIVIREIWVALVLRGPAQQRGGVIAAEISGKIKMAMQCAMIVALMIPGNDIWTGVQITLVVQTIGVTIWSWVDYQRRFGPKGYVRNLVKTAGIKIWAWLRP